MEFTCFRRWETVKAYYGESSYLFVCQVPNIYKVSPTQQQLQITSGFAIGKGLDVKSKGVVLNWWIMSGDDPLIQPPYDNKLRVYFMIAFLHFRLTHTQTQRWRFGHDAWRRRICRNANTVCFRQAVFMKCANVCVCVYMQSKLCF